MWTLPLILLSCVVLVANGQNCGCAPGLCCSKWGYCGVGNDFCGEGCRSGCPAPPSGGGSSTTRCGSDWADANDKCGRSCTDDSQCSGQRCFNNLKACGGGGSPPSTPSTPVVVPTGGSGSVASLINQNDFNRAIASCGVNRPDIYQALVRGFTAPLAGRNELALLLGHLAHESGAFVYTEEILCKGVRQATATCPYSPYHGRGYIQLTWQGNYRAAADYWKNPAILNNPDIVMNDPTVNWQTVQYFWVTNVQPTMRSRGFTLGASTRAINGVLECDRGAINAQRVRYVQCFQQALGVTVDYNTRCPAAAAVGDDDADAAFGEESYATAEESVAVAQNDQGSETPAYAIALIVLGAIVIVVAVVIIVQLAVLLRSKVERA